MSAKTKFVGVTLATAAAFSFVTAPLTSGIASAHSHHVKCYGVNGCKGHSKCKTAKNACKGKNSCKGQGFKEISEKKCTKLHGSTEEPK